MRTFLLSLAIVLCSATLGKAQFEHLVVTSGFNADVIANGVGTSASSTTVAVDNANFGFMSVDFQPTADAPPAFALPLNGVIQNGTNAALTYQLGSYAGDNSLRIATANTSGTLVFSNEVSASKLYLLATSGSGSSTISGIITFDDNSTQTFSGVVVPDWFNSTAAPVVSSGFGRVNRATDVIENPAGNPRFYQLAVSILPANQLKTIVSLQVTKTSTAEGVLNLMAVTAELLGDCSPPYALTASLNSVTSATVSWNEPVLPSESFEYVFATASGEPTGAGTPTTDLEITNAELTANTVYYFYVRSVCTDSYSGWAGPVIFSTFIGDDCASVINLDNETSPYTGTTVGAINSITPPCMTFTTASDIFLSITVPVNYSLSIGQTTQDYDSGNFVVYGDCPGSDGISTLIACWDDPNNTQVNWTNHTGQDQTVYWIQDGYNANAGGFTLAWTLTAPPACIDPINLVATPSGLNASITWALPPATVSEGFEYVLSTENVAPTGAGTSTIESELDLEDLTLNTTYYFFVRANCGDDGYSAWVSTSFYIGYCLPTVGNTGDYISSFTTQNALANVDFTSSGGSPYTNNSSMIITEHVGGNFTFSTTYVGGTNGVNIWIDWDNSMTFEASENVFSQLNNPALTTGTIVVPIDAPIGSYRLRIRSQWGTGSNPPPCGQVAWGETEDYTLEVVEAPDCLPPASITGIPNGTSVDLSWTEVESPSGGYEFVVSAVNEIPTGSGTPTTEMTANVADLTPGTTYYAFLRSDCDIDGYSLWISTSFYIGYCQVTSTSTAYGINNFTTTAGYTNINNTSGPGSYNDFTSMSVSQSEGGVVNFTITPAVGTNGMGIWIDWNNDLDFADAGEQVYSSGGYVGLGTGTITVPTGTPIGNYRMRVVTNWLNGAPSPCGDLGNPLYGEAEDYTFMVVETPACVPPVGLTASVTTPTTATISWTSPSAPADGYEYVITPTATTPVGAGTPTSEMSADITDLDFGTVYAYVRANCGDDGYSMWTGPVAITIIEGDICATVINLDDEISPYTNTTVGANNDISPPCMTFTTAPDLFFSITVPQDYTLVIGQTTNDYDSGNYIAYGDCPGSGGETTQIACWDDTDEQTHTWTNITSGDATVYWIQDGYNTSAGTFTLTWTLTPPPTCIPPNTIVVENISETSGDISWNAPSTIPGNGYEIVVSTSNTPPTGAGTPVDDPSFDATDLTSGTVYFVFVRSNCDDVDFSPWVGPVSFATALTNDEPCNAVPLTVSGECNYEFFINTGATDSSNESIDAPGCAFYQGGDIWFTVTVPANGHVIVDGMTGTLFDCGMALYSSDADCDGNLTLIECDDDDSDNGNMPRIERTDLTPGSTLYIRWWEYGNDATGTFGICVTTPCTAPGNPTLTVSANTATATWTSAGEGAIYNWEVRESGAPGSGAIGLIQEGTTDADVLSVLIENLGYASTYQFYVSTNCGEGVTSAWSTAVTFTTEVMQGCTDPEACNYNADAMVDDESCVFETTTLYADTDGDGFGDADESIENCGATAEGYVANDSDCDDTNAEVWQSASLYVDADGDGYDAGQETVCYGEEVPEGYSATTLGNDCDDEDAESSGPSPAQVTLTLPVTTVCDNSAAFNLTGGSPAGGTWSGEGVTGSQFNPAGLAAPANYTITYTVAGDGICTTENSATATITVDDCIGVDEVNKDAITLYPTFTNNNVTVVGIGLKEATIMDANGKRHATVSLFNTSIIDMQSFAAGIYFIQVTSNTTSEVFRVVKVN